MSQSGSIEGERNVEFIHTFRDDKEKMQEDLKILQIRRLLENLPDVKKHKNLFIEVSIKNNSLPQTNTAP